MPYIPNPVRILSDTKILFVINSDGMLLSPKERPPFLQ